MNRINVQQYQMLTRVVDFGAQNVSLFPETTAAAEILKGLAFAVSRVSGQASLQVRSEAALRTSRSARGAAREALKTRLALSEQIALALKSDKFRAPRRKGDQGLIHAGHAFAAEGVSLTEEFAKYGLPQFSDSMNAAVQDLEDAILGYSNGNAMRSGAIRELGSSMAAAMDH